MRLLAGAAIVLLALLSFFQFPGHTWLQQDTQIYAPILEHLRDPSVLDHDLVVQHPHVSFTLYDEQAIAVQRLTTLDFKQILSGEQVLCRALGIWGVYLLATAAGLDLWGALLVAAIFSLGATIAGPSVLTFEYEPSPRALAIPLLFCALGLTSHKRFTAAGIVMAAAFLIHPPSTLPFWIVLLCICLSQRTAAWSAWIGCACAVAAVTIGAHFQPGVNEQQEFFTRLNPQQEQVQRLRTAYNWISIWGRELIPQYIVLYALAMLGYARVKQYLPMEMRTLSIVLPAMGILSMPLSWLLLEQLKWSLVPQLQPMRALLFVTAFAVILASIAALKTSHIIEAAAWFTLVFYIPMQPQLFDPPSLRIALTAIGLGAFASVSLRLPRQALLIAGALAFFVIPGIGDVSNYPNLHTPEIDDLSHWVRDHTPRAAVFLFPDAGHSLDPGLFRVKALRAVYVDWKSGGQVNYLKDFAGEWRTRWDAVNHEGFDAQAIPAYRALGIDYLVLLREHALAGLQPVYENSRYAVYRITE